MYARYRSATDFWCSFFSSCFAGRIYMRFFAFCVWTLNGYANFRAKWKEYARINKKKKKQKKKRETQDEDVIRCVRTLTHAHLVSRRVSVCVMYIDIHIDSWCCLPIYLCSVNSCPRMACTSVLIRSILQYFRYDSYSLFLCANCLQTGLNRTKEIMHTTKIWITLHEVVQDDGILTATALVFRSMAGFCIWVHSAHVSESVH